MLEWKKGKHRKIRWPEADDIVEVAYTPGVTLKARIYL